MKNETTDVSFKKRDPQVLVRWTKSGLELPHEEELELPISFGRDKDNTIVLPSKQVSRHHAVIEQVDNQVILIDNGSTNGTLINGKRRRQMELEAEDEIAMGEYTITVEPLNEDTQVVKKPPPPATNATNNYQLNLGMAQQPHISESNQESLWSRLNAQIGIKRLLYVFWAAFWLLNGLDKFFNGVWFGVTRDAKMIAYFESLSLPPELALTFLYGIGIFEIIVGLVFLVALVNPRLPKSIHLLAFKSSMLIFAMFSVGDILFGDRGELWEHGTFMILALLSYFLYTLRQQATVTKEQERHSPAPHVRQPSVSPQWLMGLRNVGGSPMLQVALSNPQQKLSADF